MWEWLSQPAVQAILAVAVLLVTMAVGYQVLMRLRPTTIKDDTSVDHLAQNFEEMQLGGDINADELRKIKAVLGKTQDSRPGD